MDKIYTFFGIPITELTEKESDYLLRHKSCDKQLIESIDGDYAIRAFYCKTHQKLYIFDEVNPLNTQGR